MNRPSERPRHHRPSLEPVMRLFMTLAEALSLALFLYGFALYLPSLQTLGA